MSTIGNTTLSFALLTATPGLRVRDWSARHVPAIIIGSGGQSSKAHTLQKWRLNDNGYQGTRNALLILLAEAGIAK